MDAGSIVYEVDIETREAIEASEKVSASLDKMDKRLNESEKSAKGLKTEMNKTAAAVKRANDETSKVSSSMKGFIAVVGAFLTLRAAQYVSQLSDVYGQMASRVRNATSSIEEYELVQSRLLETANGTYRSLSEAQEVYLATADVLRDLGYETSQVLDITDSLSYAFVRDATRADQARTAMDAYSKALIKGKIDADGWVSMMNATPSLIKGIAQATGESEATIRQLGVTGKLSIEALNEGLRRSRGENKAFADEMEVSTKDAFTKLTNSMTVFVGKMNESSGASSILTDNVALLADALQDPEVIKAAQDMAGGVVAAINGIITSTKEAVKFVQWMGEELAYTFKGAAASDDIVRLERKLNDVRGAINNPTERLRFFGDGGVVQYFSRDELEAEAKLIQSQIDDYYKNIYKSSKRSAETAKEAAEVKVESEEKVKAHIEETAKTSEKASRDLDKSAQNNIKVIHQLEQQLLLAALSGEALANAKAKASLNEFAKPEEVERVRQLSSELYKLEEINKRKGKFGGNADSYITGSSSPLSGGAFDDQYARYEQEAVLEQERYAKQLERLKEAKELEIQTNKTYQDLEAEMAQQHAARMEQIEMAKRQVLLSSAESTFGSLASILENAQGRQSSAYRAMFAISKGFAIAQASLNLSSAISQAMADPSAMTPAQKFANMAVVGAAGANLVNEIAGAAYGGGRQYGGPVESGKMYRINENGAPEIYQSANGQQYMMPNTRGEVISNKSATSGSGITNNITISIDSGGVTSTGDSNAQGKAFADAISAVVSDKIERESRPGGSLWRLNNGR